MITEIEKEEIVNMYLYKPCYYSEIVEDINKNREFNGINEMITVEDICNVLAEKGIY